jgi:hypothetical protein
VLLLFYEVNFFNRTLSKKVERERRETIERGEERTHPSRLETLIKKDF